MSNYTTNELTNIFSKRAPSSAMDFVASNKTEMINDYRPFSEYIKNYSAQKKILLQDIIARANFSEGYGYKILSETKKTRKRDVILRITLALRMSLEETQKALKLYGMSPLYSRIPRDALLISCISQGMHDVYKISEELEKAKFAPLES